MEMDLSKRTAVVLSSVGVLLLAAGVGFAVDRTSTDGRSPAGSTGTASQEMQVRSTAEAAVTKWQTLFVEEPQQGVTSPDQVTPSAHPMSSASAAKFVEYSSNVAAQLFEGKPLEVLKSSLASEVQGASTTAANGTSSTPTPGTDSPGGYTVCVAAGARSFDVEQVSVSGTTATADLKAFAWTTNVDHFVDGHSKIDTAQGFGQYHLELTQSAAGDWLITAFSVEPIVAPTS